MKFIDYINEKKETYVVVHTNILKKGFGYIMYEELHEVPFECKAPSEAKAMNNIHHQMYEYLAKYGHFKKENTSIGKFINQLRDKFEFEIIKKDW